MNEFTLDDKSGPGTLLDSINTKSTCLWNKRVHGTQIEKFMKTINSKHGKNFQTYWELHEWSVKDYRKFWEEILVFFDVIYYGTYDEVAIEGESILNVEWFRGAKINFAENLLRHKDERIALICLDEDGNEDIVTYAEMYKEVEMYAAAFKILGLEPGDMVACYMSNRKEAVFAMMGAVSLGGIWGGSLPHYGELQALNILRKMNPKFLITMDRFQENGQEQKVLPKVPAIVNALDSLIKVVIVPTKPETLSFDISGIRNSCFLKDFLELGKREDGDFPEINFVRLPFNYPVFINFSSGTTGPPRKIVHPAVTLLTLLRDSGLHLNITEKDISLTTVPVGWTVWTDHIPDFLIGSTVLVYNGRPVSLSKTYFWDLFDKYKITCYFLLTSLIDELKKNEIIPGAQHNLGHLRMLAIGGMPVNIEHYDYLYHCVQHENFFAGSLYGSSEFMGSLSGFDLNTPLYSGEIQVPALGVDFKCYDREGNSIFRQLGELVITNRNPASLLHQWDDETREKVNELNFTKYAGVWCQNDECWINPKTKGLIVIGRSDDTLTPYGIRFGAVDIYFCIHAMEELDDYLCVEKYNKLKGDSRCVLFVKLKPGYSFSVQLSKKIKDKILSELTFRHVPELIVEMPEIPYNFNNKRMEGLVRTIISTNKIPQPVCLKNPECLTNFLNIPELQNI